MSSTAPNRSALQELFDAIDAMDTAAFAEFLTDEAQFRFGSTPIVKGKTAIAEAVGGFFKSIAALRHDIEFVTSRGDVVVVEGNVTYTRHDGRPVVLPFVDIFTMDGTMIANYKIYMDIAPLYAE